MAIVKEKLDFVQSAQERLSKGNVLKKEEEKEFEKLDFSLLTEKQEVLQNAMKAMIDEGKLNRFDKAGVIEQVQKRIKELESAASDSGKRRETRQQQLRLIENKTKTKKSWRAIGGSAESIGSGGENGGRF